MDELYWYADYVNGNMPGGTHYTTYAQLKQDIIINSGVLKNDYSLVSDTSGFRTWTPMEFQYGTFDGGGHTISGLYIGE